MNQPGSNATREARDLTDRAIKAVRAGWRSNSADPQPVGRLVVHGEPMHPQSMEAGPEPLPQIGDRRSKT